jgi:hypothetical protein
MGSPPIRAAQEGPTFENALNLLQRRGRIQALNAGSPELDADDKTRQQVLEECREREPEIGRLARRLMDTSLGLSQIDR